MLQFLQLGSPNSTSGDIQVIILMIFSVHVMATAIFRICQAEGANSQSASQAYRETHRGVVVGAVVDCVVYPAVLINILGTRSQHYDGQNAVSDS